MLATDRRCQCELKLNLKNVAENNNELEKKSAGVISKWNALYQMP